LILDRSPSKTSERISGLPKKSHFGGRFLVTVDRFPDPYLYGRGREITVASALLGEEIRPLGKIAYRYPLLLGKQVDLWGGYPYRYPSYYYPYGAGWF
jgi:starvation-inducible outer membrane lipoprotein